MSNKNVPKLRFQEFRGKGEWEDMRLGDVSDVRDGTYDSPKYHNTGKPLITSKNLLSDGVLDLENVSLISEDDFHNINKRSQVDVGDILFGMIGTIGNPVMVKSDDFAIKNVALVKQKSELMNCYLVHFLNSQYIAEKIEFLNTGNSQKFIALGQIRNLSFYAPSTPEQQKIADCLTSLDQLITAQAQKIDTLKVHKKGLMQQLFPAEGETLPKLRFPEFRDKGEWELDSFDKIVDVIDGDRGTNYPKAEEFSKEGFCLFLNAKNVTKSGFKFDEKQFITIEKDGALRKGKLQRNDIVLTTRGSVGQFAFYSGDIPYENMRINSGMVVLRAKTKKITPDYFYAFSKSERLSMHIENIAFGNAQQQLTVAGIKKFFLYYPSKREQQKIADCLSSIDELITAQTQKLDALKAHKKGLMQQLFPSADEVGE